MELRLDVTDWEIDGNKKTYEENNTPKMVLIEAARQPLQEAYYSSLQEIGQCHKTALTNRAKSLTLELGINLQDVRIPISKNNTLRLIRNQRGKLTYIPEDIWNLSVREIARHNKEIKISGQDGNHKINSDNDPRVIPNNVELETRFGEDFMTKKKKI